MFQNLLKIMQISLYCLFHFYPKLLTGLYIINPLHTPFSFQQLFANLMCPYSQRVLHRNETTKSSALLKLYISQKYKNNRKIEYNKSIFIV